MMIPLFRIDNVMNPQASNSNLNINVNLHHLDFTLDGSSVAKLHRQFLPVG